ncbi:MAG: transglutaminase domain-containing protein [Pirellulaceae bacterium]|nr:transglutaminase domain-containing protein [Pirellulaceae bacterium]
MMKTGFVLLMIVFLLSGTSANTLAQDSTSSGPWWSPPIENRLTEAGENQQELRQALKEVKYEHRRALEFLIEHMPTADLKSLSADYLLENIELAYQGINEVPWGKQIPEHIFFNDILPYANVDETREPWRRQMMQLCLPLVKDCKTPGEAAQKLNRELFPLVNVKYSTSRKKANQSPSESMQQNVASCTGLSIILTDACRSVGVPSRLAGTPSWTNKRGNHTWVEVWDNGWQFTGAAEPSSQGLNHGWFQNDAAMADDTQPMNRIYAVSFAKTGIYFPMVWSRNKQSVSGVNVTSRYTTQPRNWDASKTRVLISLNSKTGERLARDISLKGPLGAELSGQTRGESADMNDILMFELPRNQNWQVTWEAAGQTFTKKFETGDTEQTWWKLVSAD